MSSNEEKKSLFELILGSKLEIAKPYETISEQDIVLKIFSNDLYLDFCSFFDQPTPYFQTNLPLEKIVRYKDGTFSSMEKSIKGGISQHEGYSIVSSMDMAQKLMYQVMPNLNRKLTALYSDIIAENNYYLAQLQNSFITPEISKLKSIADFTRELLDDIEQISKSEKLSIATLTNVQNQKIELKKTFYTFISFLEQQIHQANSPTPIYFNESDLANNYLVARHALSFYIVSLVLECVISGNLDDNSVEKMKERVIESFQSLNDTTTRLSNALKWKIFNNQSEINNINSFHYWSIDYFTQQRQNNLYAQNYSINQIQNDKLKFFDIDHEMQRIEKFISSRRTLLQNIQIRRSE